MEETGESLEHARPKCGKAVVARPQHVRPDGGGGTDGVPQVRRGGA